MEKLKELLDSLNYKYEVTDGNRLIFARKITPALDRIEAVAMCFTPDAENKYIVEAFCLCKASAGDSDKLVIMSALSQEPADDVDKTRTAAVADNYALFPTYPAAEENDNELPAVVLAGVCSLDAVKELLVLVPKLLCSAYVPHSADDLFIIEGVHSSLNHDEPRTETTGGNDGSSEQ